MQATGSNNHIPYALERYQNETRKYMHLLGAAYSDLTMRRCFCYRPPLLGARGSPQEP